MVTNSDRAGIFNMGQQMTDADRALLASSVDHVYQQFTQKVAEGRRLPLEKVEEIAQGRVYTGAQGLELKLIDKIGGLQDAFREAKILAGFDPGKLYPVKQYESAEKNPLACLRSTSDFMDCLRQGQTSLSALVGFFQPAPARELKKIQNLHQLLQDDRIWAYWPHQLTTQSASSL
jgi:protease-4